MVLEGVIVYSNFMKVFLTTFRIGFVYGRPKKVNPLSPPRRARLFGSTLPILTKLASLITNVMLSRLVHSYISMTYTLSLSSILTVLLS